MTRRTSPLRRRMLATTTVTALLAGSLLASALPASAADDPIDGAHTSGDPMFPNVGNGGYDALDYDIDIAWSPTGTAGTGNAAVVTGQFDAASTTMTARATSTLRSFSLDFEGLTVDSVLVNGQPATWTRDIDPAAIKYKLVVTPATPVSGEFTVTVNYSGVPQAHIDTDGSQEGWSRSNDGAILLGQPIGSMAGYPHNNTPADKATYSITVNAPTELQNVAGTTRPAAVASNGVLTSSVVDGARTVWSWRQDRPMASELAVIAIGQFDIDRRDVALTDGTVIPSISFIDSNLSTTAKTTILNRLNGLETMTRNLESLYGRYPGASTGIIVDPVSRISYALETQDRSFFPSASSVAGNTFTHELIHQWYGNNVAPTTWTDIWIGEGMASWGPTFYNTTEGFGAGAIPSEQTYYNAWNREPATSEVWEIAPGQQTDSAMLYDFQTYDRGAQFWAALKIAIGNDDFFAVIKEWQARFGGQSRAGADLKALAEEISGADLTAFWTDWILEADKPAWPDKFTVSLAGGSETALLPGDEVTYTVTTANTGLVPLASSVVTVDVSALLANAELEVPAGATLEGGTLTWPVPAGTAVGASAQLVIEATIAEASAGGTFAVSTAPASLGGSCATCTVDTSVVEVVTPTEKPTIAGQAVVGQTLTATSNGWPEGTALTYEWAIDGVPVEVEEPAGEPTLRAVADAGPQFVIPASAVGARITVTVTGSLDGFRAGSVTSDPTAVVTAAAGPGGGTGGGTGGGGAATPGDRLSDTGGELPTGIALMALVLLVGGGMFAAARRRRSEV